MRSATRANSIRSCASSRSRRTGILCEAPYEIVAHKRIGKNVGVTDEQNAALENWQSATCFNEVQRAALAFTDEIVKLNKPTDATFKAIAAEADAGRADRTAALGRLLHHDVEVPRDVRDRHAAGDGSGELELILSRVRCAERPERMHCDPGEGLGLAIQKDMG